LGNGFYQTGKLLTLNDNYWGDRFTVDKLGQVYIALNPGTANSVGIEVISSPSGATATRGMKFNVLEYGSGTYAIGFEGEAGAYAYLTDAYINQAYAGNIQTYFVAESGKTVSWTDAVGLNIRAPSITGAGTKTGTNTYGIRIFNQGNAANTNTYGIWIDDQSGSATLNYAIYTKAGNIRLMASGTDKFGMWGATPIVQPTTAIAAATFAANTSGIVNDTATFDGYTIGQIVKALRNIGALA
jgi:hypothetical protein